MNFFLIVLFFINCVKSNHEYEYTETTLTCDFKEIEKYIESGNVGDRLFRKRTSNLNLRPIIGRQYLEPATKIFRRRPNIDEPLESGPNDTVTEHVISQHYIITLKEIS